MTSLWQYVDTAGQVQGPFTTNIMTAWASAGWFHEGTLVFEGDSDTSRPIFSIAELWEGKAALQETLHAKQTTTECCGADDSDLAEGLTGALSQMNLGRSAHTIVKPPTTTKVKTTKTVLENKVNPYESKLNALRGAQAGQVAWQTFQKASNHGGSEEIKGVADTVGEKMRRAPVSFKLGLVGGKDKKKKEKGEKEKNAPTSASPTDTAVSTTAAAEGRTETNAPVCKKRQLFAVVDTNTWIDEAFYLTTRKPASQQQQQQEKSDINREAFLQGLETTDVKIVLPSQVVRELDGLKEGHPLQSHSKPETRSNTPR